MPRQIAVIINTGSGQAELEEKFTEIRNAFQANRLEADFFLAYDGASLKEAVHKAVEQEHKVIVAAGGDGTINAVASQIINSKTLLGILPAGTFNHLARDLGIPTELDQAVKVIAQSNSIKIDAGQVNDKAFLNNSSIGIYSKLVRYRQGQQKEGWDKKRAMIRAIVGVLWRYSFWNVEIGIGEVRRLYRTSLVFIGNNKYDVDGFDIGTRKSLSSGKLCLYILKDSGRFGLIRLGLKSLFRILSKRDLFEPHTVTEVHLKTRKKLLKVALDGEVVTLPSPLEYKILPEALNVIVPK